MEQQDNNSPSPAMTPEELAEAAPRCGWCKQSPAQVAMAPVQLGPFMGVVIFCANPGCRKIHNVNIVGMDKGAGTAPASGIILPGRMM